MKKLLALLLVFGLAVSAAVPAAAAEGGSDEALAAVTRSVKETLELDTGGYDDFQGDYESGELVPMWYLSWRGDAGSLTISALADGTVASYTRSDADQTTSPASGLPAFPEGDEARARAAAQAFLGQVLGDGETAALDEAAGTDRLDSTTYRFSGTILLHGLPSPLSCSVTVRASDNQVIRFWRDVPGSTFLGDVPDPSASVTADRAAQALRGTQSLRLEYILPQEESTQAVLCYLPDPVHRFYVDAKTGTLVDLTELESLMNGLTMGAAAADTAAEESGLSQAEQEGIQKLEGVKSQEALDSALRDVSAYGLGTYTLTSAAYAVGETEEDGRTPVRCTLRYSRSDGEDVYIRSFTVDARTGQVQTVGSYIPWKEGQSPALTEAQALERARSFLESFCPDRFGHLALYETPGQAREQEHITDYTFCFARQENGYFFPEHNYTVSIDASDGSVCGLTYQYDESVTFQTPGKEISADAALDAWMDTYDVTLGYVLAPRKLTGTDALTRKLTQMGLDAFYYLELGYTLEREETYRGIDAVTGSPVSYAAESQDQGLTYGDVADSWAQNDIQRLARFGVGYDGGVFQPEKTLTQWDLVCLLYSLHYTPLDPAQATDSQRSTAYAAAYAMGALTRAQRQDGQTVTRSALIRYLLDAAGYGPVARLEGIFTCDYPDRASIPAGELGYAALAQGLGMVNGAYNGTAPATRGQAAAMLCRLMDR